MAKRYTQLFIMDPYNNLGLSLFPQHDTPMSNNDIQLEYQAPQISQSHNTFQQPPGTGITRPPTSILPRPAESSLLSQGHTKMKEHASQMLMPFPIHNQSDGSEASLCPPSPPSSVSSSPSHTCNIRATGLGKSRFVKCVLVPKLNLRSRASMPFGPIAGYPSKFIPKTSPPALSNFVSTLLFADKRRKKWRCPHEC
jgi:hypothetical protein